MVASVVVAAAVAVVLLLLLLLISSSKCCLFVAVHPPICSGPGRCTRWRRRRQEALTLRQSVANTTPVAFVVEGFFAAEQRQRRSQELCRGDSDGDGDGDDGASVGRRGRVQHRRVR